MRELKNHKIRKQQEQKPAERAETGQNEQEAVYEPRETRERALGAEYGLQDTADIRQNKIEKTKPINSYCVPRSANCVNEKQSQFMDICKFVYYK